MTISWKINYTVWMANVKYHTKSVGRKVSEVGSVHGFLVRKFDHA